MALKKKDKHKKSKSAPEKEPTQISTDAGEAEVKKPKPQKDRTGLYRSVPVVLFGIAAFITLCFITGDTGKFGGFISNALLGLFSYMAYAIPVLVVIHALTFGDDIKRGRLIPKIFFSLLILITLSEIAYIIPNITSEFVFDAKGFYENGTKRIGGGFVGSAISCGVTYLIGKPGLFILIAVVIAVTVIYFVSDKNSKVRRFFLEKLGKLASFGAELEERAAEKKRKDSEDKRKRDIAEDDKKNRDLYHDTFFSADNGVSELVIPELGIKETKLSISGGAATLRTTVIRDEEDGAAKDTAAPPTGGTPFNSADTDFADKTADTPRSFDEPKDTSKHETLKDFGLDDSADAIFTKDFDPYDLAMNEKQKGKASSFADATDKGGYSEYISDLTPEQLERQRRLQQFEEARQAALRRRDAKRAEDARLAEEARIREEARVAEEARLREEARLAEEARLREEARLAEEARLKEEARLAEEARRQEDAKRAATASRYMYVRDTAEGNSEPETPKISAEPKEKAPQNTPYTATTGPVEYIFGAPHASDEPRIPDTEPTPCVNEPITYTKEPDRASYGTTDPSEDAIDADNSAPTDEPAATSYAAADSGSDTLRVTRNILTPELTLDISDDVNGNSTIEKDKSNLLDFETDIPIRDDFKPEPSDYDPFDEDDEDDGEDDLSGGEEPVIHKEEIPLEERNPKLDEYRKYFNCFDADSGNEEPKPSVAAEPDNEDDDSDIPFSDDGEDEPPFDEDDDEPPFDTSSGVKVQKEKTPAKKKPQDYSKYKFPPLDLLKPGKAEDLTKVQDELNFGSERLINTLESFGIRATVRGIERGPRITRYSIVPAKGVRVNQIEKLSDDLALAMEAESIRIEAPIPGKSAVGVEVPNKVPSLVSLRELLESDEFVNAESKTTVCIGKSVEGALIFDDISNMPHLLIAGATGMGKSVCINSLITSMLYKAKPDEVKFIMIDPKMVEFAPYNGIPHLLVPVVTDPKQAAGALLWAVDEMNRRYNVIKELSVKTIDSYNTKVKDYPELGAPLPKIVIFIDELNDLMLQVRDPVENLIMLIAQKARAAGIHLVIGTQRPSVNVITGVIKANIPSRIACKVSSGVDSRTILEQTGAEKLIGKGDMLVAPGGKPNPKRVQGAFVSEGETEKIVDFIRAQVDGETYDEQALEDMKKAAQKCDKSKNDDEGFDDDSESSSSGYLYDRKFRAAVELAIKNGSIATSFLQRKFSIGFGKAARYIDVMEDLGIVGEKNGSKPREVLIDMDEWHEKLARLTDDD